jgi:hypothetical protein
MTLTFWEYGNTAMALSVNMRRGNKLYLSVFKPDRLLYLHSFESDQVKTKWLIKIKSNPMDCTDGPSESSEGTIIGHAYAAAYGKYFYPKIC